MPVLPAGARRMWLRRFAKATRRTEWAATQPSILGARMSASVASQTFDGLDVDQVSEILIVEAGALGPDAGPGVRVVHDGTTLKLNDGPNPLPSDRSWDWFTVIT
jgi:hypothetical protein